MKQNKGIPLNIEILETIGRLLLMIPTGILAVLAITTIHTYIFIPIPVYLLITAVTRYAPIKHLFRIITHKPVFTDNNVSILLS